MYQNERAARWAAYGRWMATVGAGIALAACYVMFQPAAAQDKGLAARPAAVAPKPAKAAGTKLTAEQSDELAKAALAESEKKETDEKAPKTDEQPSSRDIFRDIQWNSMHMWAVYAILAVSILAVAFGIERIFGLRRGKVLPTDLIAGLKAIAARKGEFDLRHAQRLCKQYPSTAAVVFRAMFAKVGRPPAEIEHALSEASEREATRLYANVRWQNLAFNVAPMLGLAGTVHGMIIAFFVTAHMPLGLNKMESLATGIYAALVCTFAGLVVAIPAGVLSHFFEGRILQLFQELDDVARMLIPHLERFEGRVRGKLSGEKGGDGAILEMHTPEDDAGEPSTSSPQ